MLSTRNAASRVANGGARPSDCPRFRRLVRHAWRLGPRPFGELLAEVARDHDRLLRALERYARQDPGFVRAVGADDWLDRRDIVRAVRR
jgi:hypothetical protein